ncbi:MAG: Aspartokinase [Watsoniomyces obsoletus]|nr:MAG: Aspartokinase [Watsoniomyces obsoletus]
MAPSLTNGHHPTPPPSERWIVQKFGGTSLGKYAVSIAENIIKAASPRHRVAVVCSARSSSSKAEGTTNRLLRAAREAEKPESREHETIIRAICEEHLAVADECLRSTEIRAKVRADIEAECQDLSTFLEATQKIGEISARSRDKIISKGEKLSCQLMTAILQDQGVDAELVDFSDIVSLKAPRGLDQSFYQNLAIAMGQALRQRGNKVPIITGYFGTIPGGLLDQVGRGYTDLCAALVAMGLSADELQVWKEVDGIFTADPRKVPTARLLSTITPAEAAELTFYGSEVIHPFTMEQVIRARVPIRIKNVMNPRGEGTVIFPDPVGESTSAQLRRPKRPTAVTIKRNILVINVHSNKRTLSHGFFARIFSALDRWRLSVDLISTSEVHVSMALHSESAAWAGNGAAGDQDLQGAIQELRELGTVDIIPSMAILSLVGKQMKHMMGIAGKMFSTLGDHHVNIEMISQGASEINISCVIEEREADRALNILHTNLFTFLE